MNSGSIAPSAALPFGSGAAALDPVEEAGPAHEAGAAAAEAPEPPDESFDAHSTRMLVVMQRRLDEQGLLNLSDLDPVALARMSQGALVKFDRAVGVRALHIPLTWEQALDSAEEDSALSRWINCFQHVRTLAISIDAPPRNQRPALLNCTGLTAPQLEHICVTPVAGLTVRSNLGRKLGLERALTHLEAATFRLERMALDGSVHAIPFESAAPDVPYITGKCADPGIPFRATNALEMGRRLVMQTVDPQLKTLRFDKPSDVVKLLDAWTVLVGSSPARSFDVRNLPQVASALISRRRWKTQTSATLIFPISYAGCPFALMIRAERLREDRFALRASLFDGVQNAWHDLPNFDDAAELDISDRLAPQTTALMYGAEVAHIWPPKHEKWKGENADATAALLTPPGWAPAVRGEDILVRQVCAMVRTGRYPMDELRAMLVPFPMAGHRTMTDEYHEALRDGRIGHARQLSQLFLTPLAKAGLGGRFLAGFEGDHSRPHSGVRDAMCAGQREAGVLHVQNVCSHVQFLAADVVWRLLIYLDTGVGPSARDIQPILLHLATGAVVPQHHPQLGVQLNGCTHAYLAEILRQPDHIVPHALAAQACRSPLGRQSGMRQAVASGNCGAVLAVAVAILDTCNTTRARRLLPELDVTLNELTVMSGAHMHSSSEWMSRQEAGIRAHGGRRALFAPADASVRGRSALVAVLSDQCFGAFLGRCVTAMVAQAIPSCALQLISGVDDTAQVVDLLMAPIPRTSTIRAHVVDQRTGVMKQCDVGDPAEVRNNRLSCLIEGPVRNADEIVWAATLWPSIAQGRAGPMPMVAITDDASHLSRALNLAALMGDVACCDALLRKCIESGAPHAELAEHLAQAIGTAVGYGHAEVAERCCDLLLELPAWCLDASTRTAALCRHAGMADAYRRGRLEAVEPITSTLSQAQFALGDEGAMSVLEFREHGGGADPHGGLPFLARVCLSMIPLATSLASAYEVLYAHVKALASAGSLPLEAKDRILGARTHEGPALPLAMRRHPLAAIVIATGILRGAVDGEGLELLRLQGVDPESLLRAAAVAHSPLGLTWCRRLRREAARAVKVPTPPPERAAPCAAAQMPPRDAPESKEGLEPSAPLGFMESPGAQEPAVSLYDHGDDQDPDRDSPRPASPAAEEEGAQQVAAPPPLRRLGYVKANAEEFLKEVKREGSVRRSEQRNGDLSVPRWGREHLHMGRDFIEYRNGNGGGRMVIVDGFANLDTLHDLLGEVQNSHILWTLRRIQVRTSTGATR